MSYTKLSLSTPIFYYQVFITNRTTGKRSQFSCDSLSEVNELVREKMPKFLEIHYYNSFGLVGEVSKMLSYKAVEYLSYRKIVNADNPHNIQRAAERLLESLQN